MKQIEPNKVVQEVRKLVSELFEYSNVAIDLKESIEPRCALGTALKLEIYVGELDITFEEQEQSENE